MPWTQPVDLPFHESKPLPKLGGLFHEGFHIVLVDGSIRFLRRDFDEPTLRALISRNDGRQIDWKKLLLSK